MMIRIFLIGMVLLLSAQLIAQRTDEVDFLKRLEEVNKTTQSIVSDFRQVQEFSFLDEKMESTGKFYFMKPGVMKWDQTEPEKYSFVIKSDEAYKTDSHGTKKIPLNSPQIIGFRKFILETMDGSILTSPDYDSEVVLNAKTATINLIPKQKTVRKMFGKVVLVFDQQSLMLRELSLYETEDDYRTMYFSNHKLNTLTDQAQFTK
ncbi:outer membrane lipoprotein carrier protein LolA [Reichenbachiella agarivorans]|uniref:Outer membrane lipoprotein carrier protein LolA n=1 Tax=Reichenbachiella agarivorans TaxID=2979464 RepID=A0ABY6CMS0_9BACT|nr:outer membrane lipoprotein carrier protein LolA [Reichenbachiella agarivorans]UXP30773.1 outer membrane lipoprotein carrier protein LolA [Reichenbachiella agarivorans]